MGSTAIKDGDAWDNYHVVGANLFLLTNITVGFKICFEGANILLASKKCNPCEHHKYLLLSYKLIMLLVHSRVCTCT
jgi:hypothetical protein